MNKIKLAMLVGCAMGCLSVAHAQSVVDPLLQGSNLQGVGENTVMVPQQLNCLGVHNPLGVGFNGGSTVTVPDGSFNPVNPTSINPAYNCATQTVQPSFNAQYIATGSDFGNKMWSFYSNQFLHDKVKNPYDLTNPFGTWSNVQFVLSSEALTATDLAAYNKYAAPNSTGPAIQIPLYALPIAIAYNPQYGVDTTTGNALHFNVKYPASVNGTTVGGLRLNRQAYCQIFNGEITNWKDASLQALNGGQSLMDPLDSATRWNADGAPIRLFGRGDLSGITDIFTRHLAAACPGLTTTAVKYKVHASGLPFDTKGAVSAPGTIYVMPAIPTNFAGTTNSVSGAVYGVTLIGTGHVGTITGTEAPGLFTVAIGSAAVDEALADAPDVPSVSLPTTLLNGKLSYISADQVAPVNGSTLFAAALPVQKTNGGLIYSVPTAANVGQSFTGIFPPQTEIDLANPLAWVSILYQNSKVNLANPVVGYPVVGTMNFVTYTCFANQANQFAIEEYLLAATGHIVKDSTNAAVPQALFNGAASTAAGLGTQVNLPAMPQIWQKAVYNTFLTNSPLVPRSSTNGATIGALGLWISNSQPTSITVNNPLLDPVANPNPNCTPGSGA